jgi:UDP-N-acetylmuramoyl-L-alanyl-D-glutamate--2,6-diaminopimelate ligase
MCVLLKNLKMKNLKELLKGIKTKQVKGNLNWDISKLEYDSRKIGEGDLFVAISGFSEDGHNYIEDALRRKAKAIVVEKEDSHPVDVQIVVPNSRIVLSELANRFYDFPTSNLNIYGVTGTAGKTTTTHFIKSILEKAGKKVGLIGTISYLIGNQVIPASNTTPESLDLQRMFAQMLNEGIDSAVMEVSSHSLVLHRVGGVDFDCTVFTNLGRDHLDFHLDMDSYRQAKAVLFENLKKDAFAIINLDDPNSSFFLKKSKGKNLTYSLKNSKAAFYLEKFNCAEFDSSFVMVTPSGKMEAKISLLGSINLYNALASAAACFSQKIDLEKIVLGLESLKTVSGRTEEINWGQNFKILVDYAHTPEALEHLLRTAREFSSKRILVLFGCGGDRDKGKRSLMGEIASRYADLIFITTDNPRSENPEEIASQVLSGIKDKIKVVLIPDRKEAIFEILSQAKEKDTVLLVGKGHESYQIIGKQKFHHSDKEVAEEFLKKKGFLLQKELKVNCK